MFAVKMINPINFLMIDKVEVKPETTAALLGLVIDSKLHFQRHVDALCQGKESSKPTR